MNTQDMTIEQINELKARRYTEAQQGRVFHKLAVVARELGKDPASPGYMSTYGPKYIWKHASIEIYVDDYGNYMTVNFNGRKVASTHDCDRFIIPGGWQDVALAFFGSAQEKADQREYKRQQERKQKLLAQVV